MAVFGIGLLCQQPIASAAKVSNSEATATTVLVLALDTRSVLPVHTTLIARPPTIAIEFPGQRIAGSLPERSVIARGIIRAIETRYAPVSHAASGRMIQSLHIVLNAPYAYRVRSESGRVIVEIKHPATVNSATLQIGLRGGTIQGRSMTSQVSERFQAMQDALARTTPTPGAPQVKQETFTANPPLASISSNAPGMSTLPYGSQAGLRFLTASKRISHGTLGGGTAPNVGGAIWWLLGVVCVVSSAAFLWHPLRERTKQLFAFRLPSSGEGPPVPSSAVLIDQLVWRALERQGYQLVTEVSLTKPLAGLLRIITKETARAALFFVGNGPFFEKQTVGRFLQAMQQVKVEQGFLVAAGSFTVPAQRMAKEHHITLIGREQLMELLSAGASSEYVMTQLEQQQTRLEEAKITLEEYAQELEALRGQRNEASWYLGEERAKSAKLEAQLEEAGQQLRRHEGELKRWEQEVITLRKQWEESQWYLGESQARVRYVETQLSALQELATRVESAEHARDEANWYLGEERIVRQRLDAQVADLQGRLDALTGHERAMQHSLEQLAQELCALRSHGERRSDLRQPISGVSAAVYNGKPEPLSAAILRDLSKHGIGLSTEQELPAGASVRVQVQLANGETATGHGRLIWQQAEEQSGRFRSGIQWAELTEASQKQLEQLVSVGPQS